MAEELAIILHVDEGQYSFVTFNNRLNSQTMKISFSEQESISTSKTTLSC